MDKIMKGIEKLSSNDIQRMDILLRTLTLNNISKVYFKKYSEFIFGAINRLIKKESYEHSYKSHRMDVFLNTEYNEYSYSNEEYTTIDLLELLKNKLTKNNDRRNESLSYKMIENSSKLYAISEEATPARKADLIVYNAYINLLKCLDVIKRNLSKARIQSIENDISELLTKKSDEESMILSKILHIDNLTGENIFNNLSGKKFRNGSSFSIVSIPQIVIDVLNTIIKNICKKDKIFTQVNSLGRSYLLLKVNEKLYWIIEIRPINMLKNSQALVQEIMSMIIVSSKILVGENFLPTDQQLPSSELKDEEKIAFVRRNKELKDLNIRLEESLIKINKLNRMHYSLKKEIQIMYNNIGTLKEEIKLNENKLLIVKKNLNQLEEKLSKFENNYEQLRFKKTASVRVKEKVDYLKKNIKKTRQKSNDLKEEESYLKRIIEEKLKMISSNEKQLKIINNKVATTDIEIELLKKEREKFKANKFQLIELNSIFLSYHWDQCFFRFYIKNEIYRHILIENIQSLICIERVLVELHDSSYPRTVGKIYNNTKSLYSVKVLVENKEEYEIYFQIRNTEIHIKQIENLVYK